MLDNIHGIIHMIDKTNIFNIECNSHFMVNGYIVGNGRDRSLRGTDQKIKPIPELFGAFKTTSLKIIHQSGFVNFHWQKSFHDTIVREEQSLL
jgi:hypothetical protein